jgi:hypothetical protein
VQQESLFARAPRESEANLSASDHSRLSPQIKHEHFSAPAPLRDLLAGESFCAALARVFIARRGEWIDGLELSQVGGVYAWRSRIAELRKAPWYLDITNRQRRRVEGGRVISEYRLSTEA